MSRILITCLVLTGMLFYGVAGAVDTRLVVRAKAKDAKFIGTSMGGASVVIRDGNGRVLAKGLTSGATGNTQKIMIDPLQRGARITDDATAKFEAVLDIDEPELLTVEVEAPMNAKPDTIKASTQVWLVPGRDILRDGVVVEIPGFSVNAGVPRKVKLENGRAVIPVQARIVMMCGCKLAPGGLWDSSGYVISAIVKYKDDITGDFPLEFSDTSLFKGNLNVSKSGKYEIFVYAYDPITGNTGVDSKTVKVK